MTPDEIRAARRTTKLTQRDFASSLEVDVALVRDWETGARFPTLAHCKAIEALAARPPQKQPRAQTRATPMQRLADPNFHALLRKLLAHAALFDACIDLAASYDDPADTPSAPPGDGP